MKAAARKYSVVDADAHFRRVNQPVLLCSRVSLPVSVFASHSACKAGDPDDDAIPGLMDAPPKTDA